jgi:phosphoserine phosphatase
LTLTTFEFHARVHALEPTVAVFDCDGTLWSGDAGSQFMRWSMENGVLSSEKTAWLNQRYEGYKRGDVSELAICGEMVQVYAGIPVATLRSAAATFFREHIEHRIFPEMLQLVTELQAKGCDIWAVSSTNDWVIEEGVKRFNIPANRVLSARVKALDDLATDALIDVPTDEGKVAALHPTPSSATRSTMPPCLPSHAAKLASPVPSRSIRRSISSRAALPKAGPSTTPRRSRLNQSSSAFAT